MSDRSGSTWAALAMVTRAAAAYQRDDLQSVIETATEQLNRKGCHLVLAGEFKQGKSTLANALLDMDLCPVDDDVATAVPTFIRFGDPASAQAHRQGEDPEELDTASLPRRITESSEADEGVDAVTINLPRRLLEGGLVLVDTPGVGGLDSAHGARTLAALSRADAVLFVSDTSQELTAAEAEFLNRAHRACATVAVAMPKTDFYPDWRRIVQLTGEHLEGMALDTQVFPVSSPLRREALQTGSREINEESGFLPLVQWITSVSKVSEDHRLSTALSTALDSTEQMQKSFLAERATLSDPEAAGSHIRALEEAITRVEQIRATGSRWQQALSDGITDLSSDVGFRAKEALRRVLEEGATHIDENDPTSIWDEFEIAIEKQVRDIMVDNTTLLTERAEELAAVIQVFFAEEEHGIELIGSGDATVFDEELSKVKDPDGSIAGSALTALRGSYSGILMFNMLGGMLGLAAIAPVSVGLGVILGVKALKGEKERRLATARQSAKQSLRKYIDDAGSRIARDNQDTIKRVQRTLRDTYAERLRVLQRTTADSLAAAQRGASTGDSDRVKRLADVNAELDRLAKLHAHISALLTAATS